VTRILPAPDATGVYTFPEDLAAAHQAHQEALAVRSMAGDETVIRVNAPFGGCTYLIERRRASGRPLVVIEPHHDDLALSASGLLLTRPRPLTVVTVFTRSATAHPRVLAAHPGEDAVSALRAEESRRALLPLDAKRVLLGYRDADPPYRPYDPHLLDEVTVDLERILAGCGETELLAPASVTRHPDHLLVHEAARRLGCTWFWEDVAFWQTYALSSDDRHLFQERTRGTMGVELVDITAAALDKLTLLYLQAPQLHPLLAMWRPLRHAWTTARGLRPPAGPASYAERYYRTEQS
jgi:LmbE family N-acetylglucosaminyl deacetylase